MPPSTFSRSSFVRATGAAAVATAAVGVPAFIPLVGEAADSIKVGLLEPATGVYAAEGENEVRGFQMAADMWNARGGVMGRKIELVTEDDASDPGIGAQKARKLVNQDKVVALAGSVSSAVSLSVSGAANAAGIIFMDSGGHTDDVTGKDCKWNTFRTCHSTWMETHATGYSLAKKFGKRFHLITPDYAFGHSLEAGYRDVLARIGGTVTGSDLVPLGTTDFSPYLTKALAGKPDVLLVLNAGADFVNCMKQIDSFGLNKKVGVGGPQAELEAVQSLPREARVGYFGIEWYYKSDKVLGKSKAAHAFVADYTKRYSAPPNARGAFGYITMDRLAAAMNDAKSTDSVKIARALEGVKFTSIFEGTAYFRKEDHQLMWPMWVGEVLREGKNGDKADLFNVTDVHQADAIEQSVAEKAKICTISYP
ncbi:MAG: ABC transporter substrate-binding protein [Candidatus Eremiobacteraeota bacterium]|nr:ABC transporter substrate-binding protein [Candidatus Eremiobacteraeota bacterium]